MKVVDAQSAVLSNYEVHKHLVEQRVRYKRSKHRGPGNLETVVKELLHYLEIKPSPLSQKPITYTPDCVARLIERLRPYDLSKGEVLMILNLRPGSVPVLNTVVEDMAERFNEDQQNEMIDIVTDVLGWFPEDAAPQDGQADADVSMGDAAAP